MNAGEFPDHRWHRGYLMPRAEPDLIYDRRERDAAAIGKVLPFLKSNRAAVQAGGNWGYWPRAMAAHFERVYTFEPDPLVFTALSVNTRGCPNVVRMQAALGTQAAQVSLTSQPDRTGRTHVSGPGAIPQIRLDDLRLEGVDLIYLDVEGMELAALTGAVFTVNRERPLVAFEEKHHAGRYGVEEGEIGAWLERNFGYRELAELSRFDRLWGPR